MGATFRKKGMDQPGQAGQPGQYGDKAVPPGLLFVQAAKELCEAAASMQENPVISAFIGATYASLKDMALQAYPEAAAQIQWQDGVGTVDEGVGGLVDDPKNDPKLAADPAADPAAAEEADADDFDLSSVGEDEDSDPFAMGGDEDEDEESMDDEDEDVLSDEDGDEDEDSDPFAMGGDEDEDEDEESMDDEDEDALSDEDEDEESLEDSDEDEDMMEDEEALEDSDEDEDMMEDEDEDEEDSDEDEDMMEDEDEDEEEDLVPPPKAKGKGKASPFPDFGGMAKKKKALGNLDKILEDTTSSVSSLSDSVGDLVERLKKMTGRVD